MAARRRRRSTTTRRRVASVGARKTTHRRRHHRVRAGLGGLNMSLIIDAILAYVIVSLTPKYVVQWFKLTGLSATTVDLIGGAVGFIAGKIFKKPALSDLSVGIAVASVVASFLPTMNSNPGVSPTTQSNAIAPASDFYRIQAYGGNYLPMVTANNYSQVTDIKKLRKEKK